MPSRDSNPSWWGGWREQAPEEPLDQRNLAARLERQRRELRLHRALFAVVALIFAWQGMAYLGVLPERTRDTVRTHRLEVLSPNGRPTVVLEADRIGGRIALRYNREGNPPPPAAFLTASLEGGALQLFQPGQDYYAVGLELGAEGQGIVKLRRRGMQPGLELSGPRAEDQGGELIVFNGEGKPAVTLGSDAQGHGKVVTGRSGR